MSGKKRRKRTQSEPILTQLELARLGSGVVAYVRPMTPKQAMKAFPSVPDIPKTGDLFVLFGADGSAIAITDTHRAAIEHAMGDELEIATVH